MCVYYMCMLCRDGKIDDDRRSRAQKDSISKWMLEGDNLHLQGIDRLDEGEGGRKPPLHSHYFTEGFLASSLWFVKAVVRRGSAPNMRPE